MDEIQGRNVYFQVRLLANNASVVINRISVSVLSINRKLTQHDFHHDPHSEMAVLRQAAEYSLSDRMCAGWAKMRLAEFAFRTGIGCAISIAPCRSTTC